MKKISRLHKIGIFFVATAFMSTGCTAVKAIFSSLRPIDHFVALDTDQRILYEPGAKNFAKALEQHLSPAIIKVEKGQYRKFARPVSIYACESHDSFKALTGQKARATMTHRGVFLSPKLLETPEYLPLILAHELSHLHIKQQIGTWKYSKLPFWFQEGLATLVSGGGGAERVPIEAAKRALINGRHFEPTEKGGIFIRKTPSSWDLKPHMFYRQSMIFVDFIKANNPDKFRMFLLELQDGKSFKSSFERAFEMSIGKAWADFSRHIGMLG